MSNYTEGKWAWYQHELVSRNSFNDYCPILHIKLNLAPNDSHGEVIASLEVSDADKSLIAAAPEMFELICRMYENAEETIVWYMPDMEKIIDKVNGESNE